MITVFPCDVQSDVGTSYPMTNPKGKGKSRKSNPRSSTRTNWGGSGIGSNKNKQLGFIRTEKVPLAYSNSTKMKAPKIKYSGDGNIVICNQELAIEVKTLTTTQTTNDFNLIVFHVNPGLSTVFPWLSSMARNYVSYQFEALELVYVPRNTVTIPGSAMIYAEYDPSASRPENRRDFLNRKKAEEVQVFKQMDFKADPVDLHKEKSHYVRVAAPLTGQDIKLLDTCIFYFAYQGTSPNTVIGDLFWKYKCKLITPTLHLGRNQITSVETCQGVSLNNSATPTLPLGVMQAAQFTGDFLGVLLNTVTGGLAGNIFTTGKAILKWINVLLPATAADGLPSPVSLRVYVPNNTTDDLSGVALISEDDYSIGQLFYNDVVAGTIGTHFIDITASNVVPLYDSIPVGTNSRRQSWVIAAPANSVIHFYNTLGTNPSGYHVYLNITDYNGQKTGLLPDPQYINLN